MADIVRPNRLKKLLKQGKIAYGLTCFTTSPAFVELVGWTGFDFVFIDSEHTPTDVGATITAVRACDPSGMTPVVRVYENNPALICKALDNGAQAVIVPHISTVHQAEAAVLAAKYAPLGDRSQCPLARSSRFGLLSRKEFMQKGNENNLVILLIEGAEGVKNTPDIVKVKGVDIINFGPSDYANTIGLLGKGLEHPKIYGALKDMVKMCKGVGVSVMTVTTTDYKLSSSIFSNNVKKIVDAGVKMISLGTDLSMWRLSCQEIMKVLR